MKLIYFSAQTLPKEMGGGSTKLPRVSFTKAGIIQFNKQACELIGLKAGDKVTLSQDDDAPQNWYFFKDKQHGFELRAAYKDAGCIFNHKELVLAFLGSWGKDPKISHKIKVAGQPTLIKGDTAKTQYWGLIF
jgi:hypothetical protein